MTDQIVESATTGSPEDRSIVQEVQPAQQYTKERKRGKEERSKKKDERKVAEQLLKGLNDVNSTEEKIEVITKKYVELVDEKRKLQSMLKQYDKKMLDLQREKDQLQNERCKALLTRERLESLCRELQKQNKAIKEETLIKIREQEQLRRKLSEEFQANLAQIKAVMHLNIDKSTKMFEEYHKMNETFHSVHAEVQSTENQFLYVHRCMKNALDEAEDIRGCYEISTKQNEILLFKIATYEAEIKALQETEVSLRSQIALYTDKYEEFQETIKKSDKISGEFIEEVAEMSKKIMSLEAEATLWKERWESMHTTVADMAANLKAKETEIVKLRGEVLFTKRLSKGFENLYRELLDRVSQTEDKSRKLQLNTMISEITNSDPLLQTIELPKDISGELKPSLDILNISQEESNGDRKSINEKEESVDVIIRKLESEATKLAETSEDPLTRTVSIENSTLIEDSNIDLAVISNNDTNRNLEINDVAVDSTCNITRQNDVNSNAERFCEIAESVNSVNIVELCNTRNEIGDITMVAEEDSRNVIEDSDDKLSDRIDGSSIALETNGNLPETCQTPNTNAVLIKHIDDRSNKSENIVADALPLLDTRSCTKENSTEIISQSLPQTNSVQNHHGEAKLKKSKGGKKKRR